MFLAKSLSLFDFLNPLYRGRLFSSTSS
jgi:hypothetical protein